ncbi:MAG: serine/threonine-protein kinase [Mycobacteriaceae bacterium]
MGRRLGHYRVDGVIGRGGMSTMYRATDVRLGRTVALKIMSEELAGDAEFRERFVDEARNTSAIDHPHIVPLYDFGDLDGLLFLAMRFVEGNDLADIIANGPLSPRRTLGLLDQVAEALDVLHARKLVHLDVKPANVLVTRSESAGREHVYLADFGLTRRGVAGHRNTTATGDFLGSPTFAAPEHLRGEHVDGRTDIYSLACMMFACLTGHAPFRGSVDEVIAGHLGGEVPAVSAEMVLPPRFNDVVWRGMASDPHLRPGSCRELMMLAHQALDGVPRPDDPPVRRSADQPDERPPGDWAPSGPHFPVAATSPQQGQHDISTMRLRDPLPTRAASPFAEESVGEHPWFIPALALLALAGLVLVIVGLVSLLG